MLVTVAGARGGVGITTLAVAVARRAGATLVDTDGPAGGVDLWLGGEDVAGVRWSGLGLAGGTLDTAELLAALPRIDGVRVLAADRADLPLADGLEQVLDVLVDVDVVVDLGRRVDALATRAVARSALVVVVVPAGAAATASAHVVVQALTAHAPQAPIGLVTVGHGLSEASVQAAVGAPVLAAVPGIAGLDRAAAGLVDGLRAGAS